MYTVIGFLKLFYAIMLADCANVEKKVLKIFSFYTSGWSTTGIIHYQNSIKGRTSTFYFQIYTVCWGYFEICSHYLRKFSNKNQKILFAKVPLNELQTEHF